MKSLFLFKLLSGLFSEAPRSTRFLDPARPRAVKAVKVRCTACGNTFKSCCPQFARCAKCDCESRVAIVRKK